MEIAEELLSGGTVMKSLGCILLTMGDFLHLRLVGRVEPQGPLHLELIFDKEALGAKKNSEAKIKEAFDIEFSGDLTMLIDDWSLASPIDKLKDKGGNPCWTVDWNWSQPAAETANEGDINKRIYDSWLKFKNDVRERAPFAEQGYMERRG